MQTFLPYPSFQESAKCLDYRRLGKQRVEAMQIYFALTKKNYGWKFHPAVKMWRGFEKALLLYGLDICYEWLDRGYKDSMRFRFHQELVKYDCYPLYYPNWLISMSDEVCRTHRSNLLRKDYKYYKKFKWKEKGNLPYFWPVK